MRRNARKEKGKVEYDRSCAGECWEYIKKKYGGLHQGDIRLTLCFAQKF